MLIKLLVLPLFSFLHSFFQPFFFITSLPVYICPFHQSLSISVHIKLVCAPSPDSADKGWGTKILFWCKFKWRIQKPFVCLLFLCVHPVTGNSFTQGSQIPSWHITDRFKPVATARIRNEIFPCMLWLYSKISVLHSDKLGCNKLWLSAVEEGKPPYMIARGIPRGITIILSLLLEAFLALFPGLTCLQIFYCLQYMQKCFCILVQLIKIWRVWNTASLSSLRACMWCTVE